MCGDGNGVVPPLYWVHVHTPRLMRSHICLSREAGDGIIIGKAWDEM